MNFANLTVGYWPNQPDCSAPGDRRRFIFYAKERGIEIETASPLKQYDFIYLTSGCNISQWVAYKKKHPETKLIFELIDSYLLQPLTPLLYFRGLIRFLSKRESKVYLNYKNAFKDIIKIADAVVCSTPLQMENIKRYNANVHVSLDYFTNEITHFKTDYKVEGKLKLVWEGQAYTVRNLLQLNDVFKTLADKIELHIITDPEIKYPFKIFNRQTKNVLKNLACNYFLYNWEKNIFSKIISRCDLSVIPINMDDRLMLNKPENKLLLLWETGIPVITSATPAYARVFKDAGLNYTCIINNEWLEKLQGFIEKTAEQRKADMEKATAYLEATHSKQQLINNWDKVFMSVM